VAAKLQAAGKDALFLIWDNAPGTSANWSVTGSVTTTARSSSAASVFRIIACYLPIKSPWLNAIEATWVHGKRRVVRSREAC